MASDIEQFQHQIIQFAMGSMDKGEVHIDKPHQSIPSKTGVDPYIDNSKHPQHPWCIATRRRPTLQNIAFRPDFFGETK
jgi:hypothetical protein